MAKWDRTPSYGDAQGTSTAACGLGGGTDFECGMVWGYLIEDVRPPGFLLERISDTDNPFAPMLIALSE
jgi:hypothetical protein